MCLVTQIALECNCDEENIVFTQISNRHMGTSVTTTVDKTLAQEALPEDAPITPRGYRKLTYFLGFFAGENISGTAFVIGAAFATWGVSTIDTILGLFIGATLGILSYTLITATLAVQTRVTLFAYLKRIGGPGFQKIYNVVNGIVSCIMAGAMIMVSVSALRAVLNIPAQDNWYPTSWSYIALVIVIGAVIALVSAYGFTSVARFATVCTPWLLIVFVTGLFVALPTLKEASTTGDAGFVALGDEFVWIASFGAESLNIFHVIFYTWGCALVMHLGLSDMAVFRFAKTSAYGLSSATGMYGGYVLSWVSAGLMGAAAAVLAGTTIDQLDAGMIAHGILGTLGIIVIFVAGWGAANPAIYRAGLAFQTLRPGSSEKAATLATGGVVTAIACFPPVFTRLVDIIAVYGLVIVPVGAIVVAEHWLFSRFGMTRYWAGYRGLRVSPAATGTWGLSILLVVVLIVTEPIHLYFMFPFVFFFAIVTHLILSALTGARDTYPNAQATEEAFAAAMRDGDNTLNPEDQTNPLIGVGSTSRKPDGLALWATGSIATAALIAFIAAGAAVFTGDLARSDFSNVGIVATAIYFVAAIGFLARLERSRGVTA